MNPLILKIRDIAQFVAKFTNFFLRIECVTEIGTEKIFGWTGKKVKTQGI